MRSIAYGFEALLVVALLPRVVKEVRAEWTQPEQPRAFTRRGLALTYAATFVFFLGLFLLTVGAAVWGRGPNPPASAPHGPLLVLLPVLGAVVMTLVMAGIRWLGWVRYRRHQQGLAGPA
jgi:hypothetical protein